MPFVLGGSHRSHLLITLFLCSDVTRPGGQNNTTMIPSVWVIPNNHLQPVLGPFHLTFPLESFPDLCKGQSNYIIYPCDSESSESLENNGEFLWFFVGTFHPNHIPTGTPTKTSCEIKNLHRKQNHLPYPLKLKTIENHHLQQHCNKICVFYKIHHFLCDSRLW